MNIWPLFGAANQLLSALVLISLAVFLKTTGRKGFMLYIPMVVMFCVTLTALVEAVYAIVVKLSMGQFCFCCRWITVNYRACFDDTCNFCSCSLW